MAIVQPTNAVDAQGATLPRGEAIIQWLGVKNGDTCAPYTSGVSVASADRSLQVEGVFGAGGSCQLEGSNDSTNFEILHDVALNTIIKTQASITQVLDKTYQTQPHITAGDVNTLLNFTLYLSGGVR